MPRAAWPAPRDVIEMFLTAGSGARARDLAAQLHDLNKDRQQTEAEIARAIFEQCIEQPVTDDDAALVFAGEGWHRGVVGIVASRVVERFHRPVFVLGIENGVAQGSGRSIPAFHLLEALETMPELFTKFGGHRQAAGLTMAADSIESFRERFRAYAAARLTAADFERELTIDAEVDFSELTDETAADLLRLAPFGFGNPAPLLVARDVEIAAAPEVRNERHLFLRLRANSTGSAGPRSHMKPTRMKGWDLAASFPELQAGSRVDLAFQIEDDPYSASRGYAPWQAILRDLKPCVNQIRAQAG